MCQYYLFLSFQRFLLIYYIIWSRFTTFSQSLKIDQETKKSTVFFMQINKTETFLITHIKQNFEISYQNYEQIKQKFFITSVVDNILKFCLKLDFLIANSQRKIQKYFFSYFQLRAHYVYIIQL